MCLRSRTELLKLGQFPSGLANKPSLFNFNRGSVYTCFLMKTSVPHSLFVTHHNFKITQQSVKPLKQSSASNVQEKKFQQCTPRRGKRKRHVLCHTGTCKQGTCQVAHRAQASPGSSRLCSLMGSALLSLRLFQESTAQCADMVSLAVSHLAGKHKNGIFSLGKSMGDFIILSLISPLLPLRRFPS